MFFGLPVRIVVKLWRRGFNIRNRVFLLDPGPRDSRSWKPWLLLLLIPTLFYLCAFYHSKSQISFITDDHEKVTKLTSTLPVPGRENLPICVLNTSQLGNSTLVIGKNGEHLNSKWIQDMRNKQYPFVKTGGYYSPPSCHSKHKVGILVPYRNRPVNLAVFLYNMHPFLMKQKLEYRMFVIEQSGTEPFNLGRLYNAGFKEMQKYGKWKCVIFHDVDLLPLDERILYTCPSYPRHMCGTVVEETDPKIRTSFGGVASMTLHQFEKVNGFSNLFWGWGGEDNDMFWRIRACGFPVVNYNKSIARYTALPHLVTRRNRIRFQLLNSGMGRWKEEGLSTVDYQVLKVALRPLCTHIEVDVNPHHENTTVLTYKQLNKT